MAERFAEWRQKIDELEQAIDGLIAVDPTAVARGDGPRTVPVLIEAMLFELRVYKTRVRALRSWMESHDEGADGAAEFDRQVTSTIHGAHRLRAILDAYRRTKAGRHDDRSNGGDSASA